LKVLKEKNDIKIIEKELVTHQAYYYCIST